MQETLCACSQGNSLWSPAEVKTLFKISVLCGEYTSRCIYNTFITTATYLDLFAYTRHIYKHCNACVINTYIAIFVNTLYYRQIIIETIVLSCQKMSYQNSVPRTKYDRPIQSGTNSDNHIWSQRTHFVCQIQSHVAKCSPTFCSWVNLFLEPDPGA